ncbi:MAG: lysine 2,3-aminomutase [Gammaproteobacteria bacterium]|nr:MAG: lysine 2,3-aminomutase [Gammaproteobacteria bacterium]
MQERVRKGAPRLTQVTRYEVYTARQLDRIAPLARLPEETRFAIRVVAQVLPFRVNRYVVEELIDWSRVPEDPVFRLVFPQREMLSEADFERMAGVLRAGADARRVREVADEIRAGLNPHPAGQMALNVPLLDGTPLPGMQHKYRETVLFFPSQGQVCHSYCTFCFRWAQFVGDKALRFATHEAEHLHAYLAAHPEVTDLLVTGGDPMVMKTKHLAAYLEPFLSRPELARVQTIRIGTKSLSFWPQRYVLDEDADDLLRLLERLVAAGRHVAVMAHFNHWRELETPIVREAVRRIRDTGAVIRAQAPLLRHINDDPGVWARLWQEQVRLGIVPYYLFVERDTGARRYFEVPLARAWAIYREAVQRVSGLARTVRGPSMSAAPGKVEIQGVTRIGEEDVFVLRFIQARNPDWVQRPFFARFDPEATWLDQLEPALGEKKFFFEDAFAALQAARTAG